MKLMRRNRAKHHTKKGAIYYQPVGQVHAMDRDGGPICRVPLTLADCTVFDGESSDIGCSNCVAIVRRREAEGENHRLIDKRHVDKRGDYLKSLADVDAEGPLPDAWIGTTIDRYMNDIQLIMSGREIDMVGAGDCDVWASDAAVNRFMSALEKSGIFSDFKYQARTELEGKK